MNLTTLVALITEIGVVLGWVIPVVVNVKKISNGTKCQLRSEMLRIYYHHKDTEVIRQYEYENFVFSIRSIQSFKR